MKTILQTLKISVLFALLSSTAWSQQTQLAVWTFENVNVPNVPNTPNSIAANGGSQSGTAFIYANGTNGSSSWITATADNELRSAQGTTLNDPRDPAVASRSYGLYTGTGNSSNGKSMVIKFSTTGYQNAIVTAAVDGTSQSYDMHQWAWSTDGTTFTNFGPNTFNNDGNYALRTVDLSTIDQLDNAADVYLRITFTGSSGAAGQNTRFDNIVVTAVPPATFGTLSLIGAPICDGADALFVVTGLYPNSTSTLTYNIGGDADQTVEDVIANGSGIAAFNLPLSYADNGETLTVTMLERTDMAQAPNTLDITTGNTAVLMVNENVTYYADNDEDGYGDANETIVSCTGMPAGYVSNDTDCDDANAEANPGEAGEILYNGFDDDCSGTIDDGNQITSQLRPTSCGTTLTQIYDGILANHLIPNITQYRFRITNITDPTEEVQYIERSVANFKLTHLDNYHYSSKYNVAVELQRSGIWLGYYGDECEVNSPAAPKIVGCDQAIATKGTFIYSEVKLYATGYQFEVTRLGGNGSQILNNGAHYFTLNHVDDYVEGATYEVRVSVKTTGDFTGFGDVCTIVAPGQLPNDEAKSDTKLSAEFAAVAFPNPFNDAFSLKLTSSSESTVHVKVFDMLGRTMEVREIRANELENLQFGSNYPAGVYNATVSQGDAVKTVRIIKR